MGLTTLDTAQILLALLIMLAMTHAMGFLFQAMKQPVVIGEILAGILLGPTLIGHFFPEASAALMGDGSISKTVLSALGQLGLIFLMFSSGLEIRNIFQKQGNRTSIFVSSIGCLIPFAMGALFVNIFDQSENFGTAGNSTAFLIIFASSIAVTSIPVISRIFIDLGIMDTRFARTVVASAVIEDIALYVVMGVALGLVAQKTGDQSILANALGLNLT
ncbi:MAG: cation:proton antiporter, partial [Proteobacteria bacterium]